MLRVIDEAIERLAEKSVAGRVRSEDIPFPLWGLGATIYDEMKRAAYGNHYSPGIFSAMELLRRLKENEEVDGCYPVLYFTAMQRVAREWRDRIQRKTGKLPLERNDIRMLVEKMYGV